jgi:hypothetical protein
MRRKMSSRPSATHAFRFHELFPNPTCSILHILWKGEEVMSPTAMSSQEVIKGIMRS